MAQETTLTWQGGMAFDVELDGHHFTIDAEEQFGGTDRGPRPKGLLLSSLAGCTGMDVVALLRNRKMPYDTFTVEADADLTDEHPKIFSNIRLTFLFTGDALDAKRIRKAVQLSQERFCGVTAMLEKASTITHTIVLNGVPLEEEEEE